MTIIKISPPMINKAFKFIFIGSNWIQFMLDGDGRVIFSQYYLLCFTIIVTFETVQLNKECIRLFSI